MRMPFVADNSNGWPGRASCRALVLALAIGVAGATTAAAQDVDVAPLPGPSGPGSATPGGPSGPDSGRPDRPQRHSPSDEFSRNSLDFLFGALKAAPDPETAKLVEARIWTVWFKTPSDTAALLMARAKQAAESGNRDLAIKLMDAIIELRPDYTEAWNRRATLYFYKGDYVSSLADIREVLAREPRHFGALVGLGMIMRNIGKDREALAAYRQALALYPYLENVADIVKSLAEKVEGRDI